MNERLLYTYIQHTGLKIDLIIDHCFNLTRTGGERSQIMREYDHTQSLVFSVYNNNNMKNLLRWGPVHDGTRWSWQSVTGSWNVNKMIFLGKFLKKKNIYNMGTYLEVANKRPPEGSQSGKFYLWCQIQYILLIALHLRKTISGYSCYGQNLCWLTFAFIID